MRLTKLFVLGVLVGAVAVIGCNDDGGTAGSGGTAGNGGEGGTGGGTGQVARVFVTSLSYDGNFPGLDEADTACTTAATDAGLSGTWTAWLSDGINNIDAADRVFTGGAPYELIDGTVIASNFADLTDGTLNAPISIDEFGNTINLAVAETWTATATNGTASGGSCQGWTTTDVAERGRIGLANAMDATWTDQGGGNTCDVFNRLYCFEDVE